MWKCVAGAIVVVSVTYGVKKYFGGRACRCTSRLDGLVVIVTGSNSGIGKALAFELAQRGATLVLACRDIERASTVKAALVESNKNIQVFVKELDLNSFDSIVKFTDCINREFEEVYALVNNAGAFYHPQQLTGDHFDVTLQTNYLGPFVLTHYLIKVLSRAEQARIINVASEAHRSVDIDDLNAVTKYQTDFRNDCKAYGVSKLGVVLFTRTLAKKLANTNIIVNAVNPGNVETDIHRHYPLLSNWWLFALQWIVRIIVIKRPREGAQTTLHAILTSDKSTGQYLTDCRLSSPSPVALSSELAEQYYNLTLEVLADKFITESEC